MKVEIVFRDQWPNDPPERVFVRTYHGELPYLPANGDYLDVYPFVDSDALESVAERNPHWQGLTHIYRIEHVTRGNTHVPVIYVDTNPGGGGIQQDPEDYHDDWWKR